MIVGKMAVVDYLCSSCQQSGLVFLTIHDVQPEKWDGKGEREGVGSVIASGCGDLRGKRRGLM